MPELGGRRKGKKDDSPHVAWEVPAFRAYADYADTEEFAAALRELVASDAVTAYMCAEAKWWQCHRRLISDRLLGEGFEVRHIGTPKRWSAHALPDFARVEAGRIVYDAGTTGNLKL